MSRVEENKEWMDKQPRQFSGDHKDIDAKVKMCIYTALLDISRSLAVIADSMPKRKEMSRTCDTCAYWSFHPSFCDRDEINPCNMCRDYSEWKELKKDV